MINTLAGVTLLGVAAVPASAASASALTAAPANGFVRLAHLSPDTPAVDVYLYSAGKKTPRLVLRHVGYGALSPYQRLGDGSYEVAMRPADAAATSKPVLSTKLRVRSGRAYTVAGMGPYKGIKLEILRDTTSVPSGEAGLRVIAASLKQPTLDVTADGRTFSKNLKFSNTTPYRALPAKTSEVEVRGGTGEPASTKVKLTSGSAHTVVVLDGGSGLKLLALKDQASSRSTPQAPPRGGVETGLGGTAARDGAASWQPVALAGAGAAAAGGFVLAGTLMVRRRRTG